MPDEKFSIPIKVQEIPSQDKYRRYKVTSPVILEVELIKPRPYKNLTYEELNQYNAKLKAFIRAKVLSLLETPITIKELKESK